MAHTSSILPDDSKAITETSASNTSVTLPVKL